MTERACVRGCGVRGSHFAACPDYGKLGGACRGCVPVEAREGSLICSRCFDRLKFTIADAPDLMARIRGGADPLKAAVYDREAVDGGKATFAAAPVSADLLDAGDAIMTTLWAACVIAEGGSPQGRYVIQPSATTVEIYNVATELAELLLAQLEWFSNRLEVVPFAAAVLDMPEDRDEWSIAKGLAKWPVEDRSYWAAQPCPYEPCSLRTVKVTPPKVAGSSTRFRCASCGWSPRSGDDHELYDELFTRKAGKSGAAEYEFEDIDRKPVAVVTLAWLAEKAETDRVETKRLDAEHEGKVADAA